MNNKNLRIIEVSALVLSVIATVLTMAYSAGWNIDAGAFLFMLWAVSPYICVFLAGHLLRKATSLPKIPFIFCAVSVLMLGFTLLAYLGLLGDPSSTAALAFVFVPFYLYIGSVILTGTGLLLAFFLSRSAKKPSESGT